MIVGLVLVIVFLVLLFVDCYKDSIIVSGIIKDKFVVVNFEVFVNWGGWEWIIGLIFGVVVFISIWYFNCKCWVIFFLFVCCVFSLEILSIVYIFKVE